MWECITSRKNEAVKSAVKLLDSVTLRREKGLFLAEGARLCQDAAVSGVEIVQLFVTPAAKEKYSRYIAEITRVCSDCRLVQEHVAQAFSSTKNSQGVFCVCKMPAQHRSILEMPLKGRYLGLEQVQNPANLGAVLRTAEALGISGVLLLGDCCDAYSPKALRAGMGAVFRLPLFTQKDTESSVKQLQERGFLVYAAVPQKQAQSVLNTDFTKPCVLLIGNEGSGLSEAVMQACSACVTIPMAGRAESLNAAGAAGILMWEMMRSGLCKRSEECL